MRKLRYFGSAVYNTSLGCKHVRQVVRFASTLHHFPENNDIKHYVITRDPTEEDNALFEQMSSVIDSNPNSLILVVERSLILKRDKNGGYTKIVKSKDELFDILMLFDSQKVLRPYPGHMSAILTKCDSDSDRNITISLRPGKNPLMSDGQTTMHEQLYGRMPSTVYDSHYTTLEEEFIQLSKNVGKGGGHFRADLTVIPLSLCNVSR